MLLIQDEGESVSHYIVILSYWILIANLVFVLEIMILDVATSWLLFRLSSHCFSCHPLFLFDHDIMVTLKASLCLVALGFLTGVSDVKQQRVSSESVVMMASFLAFKPASRCMIWMRHFC